MSDYQYPLSTGRSNILGTEAFRNLLAKSLSKAEKEVTILSAYVKIIGVEWLKENLRNQKIKCVIIARWDKGDIAQGSSDLDCYKICKDNNWQFRILNDLHALHAVWARSCVHTLTSNEQLSNLLWYKERGGHTEVSLVLGEVVG